MHEPRPFPEQLPSLIHLDSKWRQLIRELVEATQAAGVEHSLGFVTTQKLPGREGTPQPVDEQVDLGLLRPEVWGTDDLPLFLTTINPGTQWYAETPEHPYAIEWRGHWYRTLQDGMIHTHPTEPPGQHTFLSIGDWLLNVSVPYKLDMVAHKEINYLILQTRNSADKFTDWRDRIEAGMTISELTKQQRKDFTVLLEAEKPPNWFLIREKRQSWERRVCSLLELGLYSGRPGEPLSRLA